MSNHCPHCGKRTRGFPAAVTIGVVLVLAAAVVMRQLSAMLGVLLLIVGVFLVAFGTAQAKSART